VRYPTDSRCSLHRRVRRGRCRAQTGFFLCRTRKLKLESLFPKLASDPALQALFRQYYYSGNNAGNTITNLTWPVYWSGAGNVSEQGIVAAVNAY
jgi:hypothetical protein